MRAAATALADRVAHRAVRRPAGAPIIALVGPGNNGGDALLAAMRLRERGFLATAWQLPHPGKPPADLARVIEEARQLGFPFNTALAASADPERHRAAVREAIARQSIFIDGLFGIGLRRPLQGLARVWVESLNEEGGYVIAADVPSGVDIDTGTLLGGMQGIAPRCIETVTFIADKPGLHTGAALEHVGAVHVADLGVPPVAVDGELLEAVDGLAAGLKRSVNAHKGSHGSLRITGGAAGMRGALILAGLGAQRAGAGKVFLATIDGEPPQATLQPELMSALPEDPLAGLSAHVLGCGMGRSEAAMRALERAWDAACPLIIDADGLNALAAWSSGTATRPHPTLLTPHPLEAARLLGCTTGEVQADRISAARRLAELWRAHVVLKGAGSVCAAPDGQWCIVASGSPALATAGTGDVLAGVIGAFLAQRLQPWDALRLAVWVHGRAAERWSEATQQGGHIGLAASELPDWIRQTLNAELQHASSRSTSFCR